LAAGEFRDGATLRIAEARGLRLHLAVGQRVQDGLGREHLEPIQWHGTRAQRGRVRRASGAERHRRGSDRLFHVARSARTLEYFFPVRLRRLGLSE
jgi:hypothetical protein